jgi:hypothetical protein
MHQSRKCMPKFQLRTIRLRNNIITSTRNRGKGDKVQVIIPRHLMAIGSPFFLAKSED